MQEVSKKSGFTMVEIIAVLVIIGIMTAVAAPKFINMAQEARDKAVQAGIAEAKASLSVGYAKAYLANDGAAPTTGLEVYTNAFGGTAYGPQTFGDVTVTMSAGTPATDVTLSAAGTGKLNGGTATGTWEMPDQ